MPDRMMWVWFFAGSFAAVTGTLGSGGVASPGNDHCEDQFVIDGEGAFVFNNADATMEGPDHPACEFLGEQSIDHDIWYCWEAQSDCTLRVHTCGHTDVDTKIAAYHGCTCPPTDANLLACNDDACDWQSDLTFEVTGGQSYLIRLGTCPGWSGGTGEFTIACGIALPCDQPDDHCQLRDGGRANLSNRTDCVVADGFNPEPSGPSDEITEVCWWGVYFDGTGNCAEPRPDDTFEVRYYADAGGLPGSLIRSFSQASGTLAVTGPVATGETILDLELDEYEYTGTHAPVAVAAGACYWIEISNSVSDGTECLWYWEHSLSGDGRVYQDCEPLDGYGLDDIHLNWGDQAFCVNLPLGDVDACLPPVPVNDDCADSFTIFDGVAYFDTSNATTDGFPEAWCEFDYGDDQIGQDIWFDYAATCSATLKVSLCGSWYDTRLAVYAGHDCPMQPEDPVACNDDFCGPPDQPPFPYQSQVSFPVTQGELYKIRVGGVSDQYGTDGGWGTIRITCGEPSPNIYCDQTPIEDLTVGSSVVFTGNNEIAGDECHLFSGAHVWIAFDLLEEAWVSLDYCATDPPFAAANSRLARGCPCAETTGDAICNFYCNLSYTNPFLSWGCLSPGVYYYPVLSEPGSEGPYRIRVSADPCDRCADATGDCFEVHETPGCDDPDCCSKVCDFDPCCCSLGWDSLCVDHAELQCGGLADFCRSATGDCCSEQPDGGCRDFGCCVAVCECEPFCCNVEWDRWCAAEGFGGDGCGAEALCGPLCLGCPDGNVTFVEPPDGFFDARQPHPVDNPGTLEGVNTFVVTAPQNIYDRACWSLCETTHNPALHPALPPNGIASVHNDGGGVYTITLERPIAHGEVATITYDNTALSGSTVVVGRFIYHPGDVNGDWTSAPADIMAAIDSINGTAPLPDEQVDTDRDGMQGPTDILRVLDLLNGAGAYEPWLDITVDHTAPCP